MYIDDCRHSFEELASHVLPGHMDRLRAALTKPRQGSLFADASVGPSSLARHLGLSSDFSGCYVLVDGRTPKYVGISRKVLSRLRQHFRGKTHFDASLAYALAQKQCPTPGYRGAAMAIPRFQKAFKVAQAELVAMKVAFIEIENPLELYIFEAYAAMALRTKWNTFRTH
jgi:hypothetical protein